MVAQTLNKADDSDNYDKIKKGTIINAHSDLNVTLDFKMKTDYKKQKYINNRFSFVSKDGVQHCSICNQPISEHYEDCSYIKAQSKKNRLIK